MLVVFLGGLLGVPVHAQDGATVQVTTTPAAEQVTRNTAPATLPIPTARQDEGWFGMLSDIHFNPLHDPSLVTQLVAADASQWDEIFAQSTNNSPSGAGTETNAALLTSALNAIANHRPSLDYLIIGGDFFSHTFKRDFFNYAPEHSDSAYQAFVIKTMTYMAHSIKQRLPDIPVIATLGNHDTYCGNYQIEPAGKFLYDTAGLISRLAEDPQGQGFSSYPELGAYTLPHPRARHHYFVVLDNLYLSTRYANRCGLAFTDPSQALMIWLEATLYRMQREGAGVTLIMHVPFGIDTYQTATSRLPKSYLTSTGENGVLKILKRYPQQITALFSGHTHRDEFRVLRGDDDKPFAFQRIAPALSPIVNNNPSYQVYRYNRDSGAPVDVITFIYQEGHDKSAPAWIQEYDFESSYGLGSMTAANLDKLADRIFNDEAIRRKFITYHDGSAISGDLSEQNWPTYVCALQSIDIGSFRRCTKDFPSAPCGKPKSGSCSRPGTKPAKKYNRVGKVTRSPAGRMVQGR